MNKHEYICKITEIVSEKSTCPRDAVGAVFVNEDYEILATGYNGTAKGVPNCTHSTSTPCDESIHAEANAIIQAAKRGTALQNSILYCTRSPCKTCANMLKNLGIRVIYYKELYRKNDHLSMLITKKWKHYNKEEHKK